MHIHLHVIISPLHMYCTIVQVHRLNCLCQLQSKSQPHKLSKQHGLDVRQHASKYSIPALQLLKAAEENIRVVAQRELSYGAERQAVK